MNAITKKTLLFASFLVFSLSSYTQTELPGALGLTFGMNKASVKKIMIDKGGAFSASNSEVNTLAYTGVTMGTLQTDLVACQFVNDKLYRIAAIFIPPSKVNTQDVFDNIESIVKNKYGEPKSTRKFISPYSDGDGTEIDAIIQGKGTILSSWEQIKNNSTIHLEIKAVNFDVAVVLYYTDGILLKEVNAKNANEF